MRSNRFSVGATQMFFVFIPLFCELVAGLLLWRQDRAGAFIYGAGAVVISGLSLGSPFIRRSKIQEVVYGRVVLLLYAVGIGLVAGSLVTL